MAEEYAFEDGPCFTEEGQLGDAEFVVIPENPTVDVEVIEDLDQLFLNPEMVPLIGESFTIDAAEIDQDIQINESAEDMTVYA